MTPALFPVLMAFLAGGAVMAFIWLINEIRDSKARVQAASDFHDKEELPTSWRRCDCGFAQPADNLRCLNCGAGI